MSEKAASSEDRYRVVFNDELQYSIWPADIDTPAGWGGEGFMGERSACLSYIAEVWTDLRPLSARSTPSVTLRIESR